MPSARGPRVHRKFCLSTACVCLWVSQWDFQESGSSMFIQLIFCGVKCHSSYFCDVSLPFYFWSFMKYDFDRIASCHHSKTKLPLWFLMKNSVFEVTNIFKYTYTICLESNGYCEHLRQTLPGISRNKDVTLTKMKAAERLTIKRKLDKNCNGTTETGKCIFLTLSSLSSSSLGDMIHSSISPVCIISPIVSVRIFYIFFLYFFMNFVPWLSQKFISLSSSKFHSIFGLIRNRVGKLFSVITQPWRHLGAILWFHVIIHIFITIHHKLIKFNTHKVQGIDQHFDRVLSFGDTLFWHTFFPIHFVHGAFWWDGFCDWLFCLWIFIS